MEKLIIEDNFAAGQTYINNYRIDRFGISLVSFLPDALQSNIKTLQQQIESLIPFQENPEHQLNPLSSLHCTHLTLVRSQENPVRVVDLLADGHNLYELYQFIQAAVSNTHPLNAKFSKLHLGKEGLNIVLEGDCKNFEDRDQLVNLLFDKLVGSQAFKCNIRPDRMVSNKLYCNLGFLFKNFIGYEALDSQLKKLEVELPPFEFREISLVHHKKRNLQELVGQVNFFLGSKNNLSPEGFSEKLNLSN